MDVDVAANTDQSQTNETHAAAEVQGVDALAATIPVVRDAEVRKDGDLETVAAPETAEERKMMKCQSPMSQGSQQRQS